MKKTALMALAALTSLISVSAHAGSEIRCSYQLDNNWQMIVVEQAMPNKKAVRPVPFLRHKGDLKFGTFDLQILKEPNKNHMKNWTYIKAYSDIVDATFDLDLRNGKISIEQQGKYVLKNAPLECSFNQGGE